MLDTEEQKQKQALPSSLFLTLFLAWKEHYIIDRLLFSFLFSLGGGSEVSYLRFPFRESGRA